MFNDIITIIGQGLGSVGGHRLGWGLWDLVGAPPPPPPAGEELAIRYHTRYVENRILLAIHVRDPRYLPNRSN